MYLLKLICLWGRFWHPALICRNSLSRWLCLLLLFFFFPLFPSGIPKPESVLVIVSQLSDILGILTVVFPFIVSSASVH